MNLTDFEHLLEAGLLLAAPYSAWRFVLVAISKTDIRPRATLFVAMILLVAYSIGIVAIAVFAPLLLRYLAFGALAGLAYAWWRARPNFGSSRHLPPGCMEFLPVRPIVDHRYYLDEARKFGPIFKSGTSYLFPRFSPLIRIVGNPLAMKLFRRFDPVLTVKPIHKFNRFIPRGSLRYMSHDDHRTYSKIFRAAMSDQLVEGCTDLFAESARRTLAQMKEECANGAGESVAPSQYLKPMMFEILVGLLFGIGRDEAVFPRVQQLYGEVNIPGVKRWTRRSSVARPLNALLVLLEQRGANSADGSATDKESRPNMMRELHRIDPDLVRDRTVLGNMVFMAEAGSIDMSDLLVWVLKLLGDHPDWSHILRDKYGEAAKDADQLAESVIKETLRMEQSEWLFRRVESDIQIDGYVIPKGSGLQVCVREGHQDAEVFDQPEQFDPNRFVGREYPPNQYAPFGLYRHRCIGARLTIVVGRIFLRELCRGFEWRIVDDGLPYHGRFHWKPNKRFRLNVS